MLAQLHLRDGAFDTAEQCAARGLALLTSWGTPWDKRLPMGAWLSWARVMHDRARDKVYMIKTASFFLFNLLSLFSSSH